MNGLNEIDNSALRESTFIYFSEISRLKGNDITKTETLQDMLMSVLWTTDDGADDGFGSELEIPNYFWQSRKSRR